MLVWILLMHFGVLCTLHITIIPNRVANERTHTSNWSPVLLTPFVLNCCVCSTLLVCIILYWSNKPFGMENITYGVYFHFSRWIWRRETADLQMPVQIMCTTEYCMPSPERKQVGIGACFSHSPTGGALSECSKHISLRVLFIQIIERKTVQLLFCI